MLYLASQSSAQSGATYAMIRLAEVVQASGHDTIVVAPFTNEVRHRAGTTDVPLFTMPLRTIRGMRGIRANLAFFFYSIPHLVRLVRFIRKERIDIVHVNEISDVLGVVAALLARRRCVMHVRADLDPRLVSRSAMLAARVFSLLIGWAVDAVIVPSDSVRRRVADTLPGLARKLEIINDVAFDVTQYHTRVDPQPVRRELGLSDDDALVLLVSKLAVVKGHLVFLRAAPIVARAVPNAVFADVGDVMTDHYDEAEMIRTEARASAAHADVRMLGYRGDLPPVIAACNVFVHCPTYADPFPTVIPEALMMRKAVIGSRIGGIPEQITDRTNGLLVPPDDPAALAAAIVTLVRDNVLRERLAEAGEREARNRYLPASQAHAQIAVYERVLRRSSS